MNYLGGLLLLLVLLFACDGGGGGLNLGVEGTMPLEQLDADEAQQLCDEIQEYRANKLPVALIAEADCVQGLGGDSGDSSACAVVVAQCREQGDVLMPDEEAEDNRTPIACFTTSDLSGCGAAVNLLEGCVQSVISAQAQELTNIISCRSGASGAGSNSQSCQILRDLCSNVASLNGSGVPGDTTQADAGPPIVDPPPPVRIDAGEPAPDLTCEDLTPSYDGNDCSITGCNTTISCDCGSFSTSIASCNQVFGCLIDVECDAVCGLAGATTFDCIEATDCLSDADCRGYYCVNRSCSRGDGGDPCINLADCQSGSCIQPSTGGLVCAGMLAVGVPCQSGPQCVTGICHRDLSGLTPVSLCSVGAIGDLCTDDGECQSQTCVADGLGTRICADRMTGSICDTDSDCILGNCAQGGRSTGLCSDGDFDEACDGDFDCLSSNCVIADGTFIRSCGYAPGDVCVDDAGAAGVADCGGICRPASMACTLAVGGMCSFTLCGGVPCTGVGFATLNDADKGASLALINNNLTVLTDVNNAVSDTVRATVGKADGKWYWEVTVDSLASSSFATVGITNSTAPLDDRSPGVSGTVGLGLQPSGLLTPSMIYCPYTDLSVISIALDADLDIVYFAIDGLWLGGGDPAASTGGSPVGLTADLEIFPSLSIGAMDQLTVNFGQNLFVYAPPVGFEPGLF